MIFSPAVMGSIAFGVTLVSFALLCARVYRDLFTIRPVPAGLEDIPRYNPVTPWKQRDVDLELDFAYQVIDVRRQYPTEPLVMVQRYGIPVVYVFDLDAVKEILRDTETYGRKRHEYDMMKHVIGDGLITQEASIHSIHRHLVDPAFKYSNLKAVFPLFTSSTDTFVELWTKKIIASGGTVQEDIYESFLKLTLDIIGKAAFGIDFDSISPDSNTAGAQAAAALLDVQDTAMPPTMTMLLAAYPSIFSKLAKLPIGPAAKRSRALQIMDELVLSVINTKRACLAKGGTRGDGIKDMLDLLLEGAEKLKMSDKQILDHVKTVLFAGHHTTTSMLTFFYYCLADKPDIVTRLRQEMSDVVGTDDLTPEHLNKLTYLSAVMKEVLRMYSPIAKIARSVDKDTVLAGHYLPKGANVDVAISAIQMDPQYWPNPDTFDPERFMPGSGNPAHLKAYMPFIYGSRNCIGNKFFTMEAKVIICKLLPRFNVTMSAKDLANVKRAQYFTIKPDPKPTMTLCLA